MIAIVGGTGAEGFGLATRLARAGEAIVLGSRDAVRAKDAAEKLKEQLGSSAKISGDTNANACTLAELVVLTIPFEVHAATLTQLKPVIRKGAIVVDATVPLAASIGGKPTRSLGVWQGSAAQQAAEILGPEIYVVAAFHNTSAEILKGDQPVDCDVIVCSDNKEAIQKVRTLAAKIPGVRPIDGGRLENARIVEQITAMLIGMNIRHKGHSGIRITGLPEKAYKAE